MSDAEAKYESLRLLLTAAATASSADLGAVLAAVCDAVGLAGAAIVTDPEAAEPAATGGEDWAQAAVRKYASELWAQLVRDHHVDSAYLQLSPAGRALSLFCYPLHEGKTMTGAVLGLADGRRNLSQEEDFLVALATALVFAITRPQSAGDGQPAAAASPAEAEVAEKARLQAILETAIAVNHEVNNPLTAVLGNTQLLLLQAENLDAQTLKRLKAIEESALRIKEVTQKLLKQNKIRTTEYPGGLRMLDLSDSETPPESSDSD